MNPRQVNHIELLKHHLLHPPLPFNLHELEFVLTCIFLVKVQAKVDRHHRSFSHVAHFGDLKLGPQLLDELCKNFNIDIVILSPALNEDLLD